MSRTNWNFARARQNAWGAAELPPSGTSGPTPPTPAPARFARALVLGADHRARPSVARGRQGGWQVPRVWKPFEGFHHNPASSAALAINRSALPGSCQCSAGGADVQATGITTRDRDRGRAQLVAKGAHFLVGRRLELAAR